MKSPRKILHCLASITAGLFLLNACDSKAGLDQGNAPGDFSYGDGKAGHYTDFAGKWLVINYWAEWCKPCITEIPELNAFAAAHPQAVVVGVNYDSMPAEQEQALVSKVGIRYPVVRGALHQHYGFPMPLALPTTIVVSPEGKVETTLAGPQTSETLSRAVSR